MPKNTKDHGEGISPVGRIVGHLALAIILSMLLWIGRTAQVNDRILHVLKEKVDQFQMRYFIDKKESERRLDRLEGKLEKQSYRYFREENNNK